jgi:hypothetical protein
MLQNPVELCLENRSLDPVILGAWTRFLPAGADASKQRGLSTAIAGAKALKGHFSESRDGAPLI